MKRKASPTSERTYKRRKISSPTNVIIESDAAEIISPLADITNHGISPRPTQLITKHLETKRILSQTKKSINLTDDEGHIIYEDDQEYDEIEVGRGKQTNDQYLNQDIDLDDDPFAIPHYTQNTNKNQANSENQFETIPENDDHRSEIDTEYDELMDQDLEISQTLLTQKNEIETQDIVNYDDNQSMNMSLQLEIENNMHQILPHKSNDNDSMISNIFKDINISSIHKDDKEQIERDEALEDEEKAVELIDEDMDESQETILSHTISQINDNETLLEIQVTPQTKTYSLRQKQRKQHKETLQQSPIQTADVLTPISRNLVDKMKRSLVPTTRSRRKAHKRDKIRISPHEVELEPTARMQQKKKEAIQRRNRRKRSQIEDERGRTYSLLDRFMKDKIDIDDDIDEEEDEIRQMILNQSGMSQEWHMIEKRREKKRKNIRAKLAQYSTKKKKQRKRVKDADFAGVRRPMMSQQMAEEYKEEEDQLAHFWRNIEEKMKNNEFDDDIQIINSENEKELNISGRRPATPPRIKKHLERRYRKEYENMTGDIRMDIGKKKGKRVWFLNEKKDVLNEQQLEMFENDMNNSLISVTDNDEVEVMEIEDVNEIDEMGVIEDDNVMDESLLSVKSGDSYSVVSGMILPSIASLSSIVEEEEEEDEHEPFDPFAVEDSININQS